MSKCKNCSDKLRLEIDHELVGMYGDDALSWLKGDLYRAAIDRVAAKLGFKSRPLECDECGSISYLAPTNFHEEKQWMCQRCWGLHRNEELGIEDDEEDVGDSASEFFV